MLNGHFVGQIRCKCCASGAPAHRVTAVFLCVDSLTTAVVTLLIEPPARNTSSKKYGHRFAPSGPEQECVKPTYRNISYTTLQLFKFTIGMGDMEFTDDYKYKEVFYMLLIGYIILTYILLLNMLIALMNRTVEKTSMESTSIWQLQVQPDKSAGGGHSQLFPGGGMLMIFCGFQRAITIMDMEKRLPCCLKRWLRCGVEKNMGSKWGDDRRWCFRLVQPQRSCVVDTHSGFPLLSTQSVHTDQKLTYVWENTTSETADMLAHVATTGLPGYGNRPEAAL